MTVNLTLRRLTFSADAPTWGVLLLGNKPLCLIAERPWLDNAQGISCIPPGTYQCIPHNTPEKPNCWEVTGVLARAAILIHAGNDPMKDSEGCLLVGSDFYPGGISGSQNALSYLRTALPQTFMLEVINP